MATRQHAPSVPSSEGLTVIGQGIHVNGQIHGEEDLRIEGRVEGAISLTETVHVAETGVVVATVDARDVVVSGIIIGNVSATNSVSLEPGAKLVGDISTPRLIIADGAAFRGNVAMTEGSGAPAPRARATSTGSRSSSRGRSSTASASRGSAPAARAERAAPAPRAHERSAPRVAAIRPPQPARPDDEVTVVVRHSALGNDEGTGTGGTTKKKAKKSPPRGRVPKPGKRKVNRR